MIADTHAHTRWLVGAGAFLLPAAHPLVMPAIGAPSHLLWFTLTLAVAIASYNFGTRGAFWSLVASGVWVAAGEWLFGRGYGVAADDATIIALTSAVVLTGALIAGFSLAARAEHARVRSVELQLAQAQKMEAVGRLAGGIAHDFNNLLTVILSTAHVIRDDAQPGTVVHDDASAIADAAKSAADLTRQLLAFSRRQPLAKRVLNAADVVRGVEGMLRRLIGEDIRLIVETPTQPLMINADAGQIEQVVMNLAVNARDAMPAGGVLKLCLTLRRLSPSHVVNGLPEGDYVALEVVDSGIGMDEATQARIFEPFFTTKPLGQGTGLGLATVYGIVRDAGGAIVVTSREGAGAAFRVYFPAATAPAPATALPPAASAPVAANRRTILLAEDQDLVRESTRRMLERLGFTVEAAADGLAAAAAFDRDPNRVDLVIADLVMPTMGGLKLAEHVTARRPGTPILLVSGYTDDTSGLHAAMARGYAFLQKPYDLETLGANVASALAR